MASFYRNFPLILSAPNLIHLSFEHPIQRVRNVTRFKQQWQERFLEGKVNVTATLQSVAFEKGPVLMPWEDIVHDLADLVDLSKLKSLDICVYQNPPLLRNAAAIMPNLERFFFDMHPKIRHEEDMSKDDEDIVSIVLELNPLRYLSLRGLRSFSSLRRILLQHGPTLRGLMIQSYPYPRILERHGL
jgi:hypothetical protein